MDTYIQAHAHVLRMYARWDRNMQMGHFVIEARCSVHVYAGTRPDAGNMMRYGAMCAAPTTDVTSLNTSNPYKKGLQNKEQWGEE